MNLVFACEQRFYKDSCGNYYSNNQAFGNTIFNRYLEQFDKIIIFARVLNIKLVHDNLFIINDSNISFIDLPYYVGPIEFLYVKHKLSKIARENAIKNRAYICRVPGIIGNLLIKELRKKNIPYAVEVVGDPWDVFAPGVLKHPLSFIFRLLFYFNLKKVVANSKCSLFVTKFTLQKRYPPKNSSFTTYVSDVNINSNDIYLPKLFDSQKEIKIISIGSLEQLYKSPDLAIYTIKELRSMGVNCSLIWLGDGKYKEKMQYLAKSLSIDKYITFKGNVSRDELFNNLRSSDIYLHISKTEGLPRSLIEAMASGLPCIASPVGGIPELLDKQVLIQSKKPKDIANKLLLFINEPEYALMHAKKNHIESKNYIDSVLNKKRNIFFEKVKLIYE